MRHFPIFLDVKASPVLVAGGGRMAAQRARQLLSAGALVRVTAFDPGSEIERMAAAGEVAPVSVNWDREAAGEWVLALGAAEEAGLNERLARWARRSGIPVNVVDRPDLCTFIMPAIVDRSPLVVAISSGGASPTLSRLLRERLEALVPESYGRLASLAERFRAEVKRRLPSFETRQRFWRGALTGPVWEGMHSGDDRIAEAELTEALDRVAGGEPPKPGAVWLVGAGPGDPELLTLRALRILQQADVVVYDRLVSQAVLSLALPSAELIYAGKAPGDPHIDQEQIHALLLQHARAGKRVVRLKGGDPFVFGRGGEEREALLAAGVSVQVVPGITAALGGAASAGIPLTHRDHAHQVTFVTGHRCGETLDLDWQSLAQPGQTVVFYMGAKSMEEICARLTEHGLSAETPAAVIHAATTPEERILRGTLGMLPEAMRTADLGAPSILLVGTVVRATGSGIGSILSSIAAGAPRNLPPLGI